MLQRIQSLYLAAICVTMATFLNWKEILSFNFSSLHKIACAIIIIAAYAIFQHNNRRLQLRLTSVINFISISWIMLSIFVSQIDCERCSGLISYKSCKMEILLFFLALVACILARHHIKKDEKLVNNDRLR